MPLKNLNIKLAANLILGVFGALILTACQSQTPTAQPVAAQPVATESKPADNLQRLLDGNRRYTANQLTHTALTAAEHRTALAREQHPFAVVLACADSRVTPEVIFDQGMGDLFVVRVAGNIVDDAVVGSIEYAAEHLGAELLVVMGHERCGAVTAAVEHTREAHIKNIADAISPAVERTQNQGGNFVDNAVRENVRQAVNQLKSSQPILNRMIVQNRLRVVGGYYDLDSGAVSLIE